MTHRRFGVFAAGLVVLGLSAALGTAAPYTLSTGVGDGSVVMGVDGFGSFGFNPTPNTTDANYDPIGPTLTTRTSYDSGVAIRVGAVGPRKFLTSGLIGSSGGLANPVVSGTLTMGSSSFS